MKYTPAAFSTRFTDVLAGHNLYPLFAFAINNISGDRVCMRLLFHFESEGEVIDTETGARGGFVFCRQRKKVSGVPC